MALRPPGRAGVNSLSPKICFARTATDGREFLWLALAEEVVLGLAAHPACVDEAAVTRAWFSLRSAPRNEWRCETTTARRRRGTDMETPLTPLELARRARKLYADRELVVDGERRLTYRQFFERCDRWSAALQRLGVRPGDRVACIAPNTHAHLEAFYAVPQIGAVIVPINYRLTADDFAYIINHSGARVVCADAAYLETVDRIRDQVPTVEHFVAFEGTRAGWVDYEAELSASVPAFQRPPIRETDLLSIN